MALTAKKVYAILKHQISDMEAKLNSPVRYRGTVATADLLPLNPDIGDMYNIESKSIYGEAGMNVAWNGVVWDTMGAPIDMSLYLTKEGADTTIQNMVNEYLEKNPVKPGATTEQARQIEQNKTDITSLKTETSSLKEDITSKADKTSLAQTDRKLDALWKLNQGISYEFQTDEAEAYQKTVPSGAKMVSIKSIGGKLTSDDAGEQMSAPVNEVVEQGRNLFDCYGFSCVSIPNIAAKRDIANDYGTTISTIDPTNRLIVTQNKADGSTQGDYRNGYFTIGIRGLKHNTNYILAFDFTPTKMLIVDPIIKLLVNGKATSDNSVYDFTLNVKKHVTIKFVYNANNDGQFLELRNNGMSGIFENFQIEEGTTVATYSPYHKTSYPIPQAVLDLDGYGESGNFVDFVGKKYHKGDMTIDISDIIGDTFQEPLEVEAGGTLTFKNSHGDDYRIPVPSSEEYVISLAEVEK